MAESIGAFRFFVGCLLDDVSSAMNERGMSVEKEMRRERGMEKEKSGAVTEKDLKTIIEFIESIQFGSVSIVIQNGKIVQIEKNEKVRLS